MELKNINGEVIFKSDTAKTPRDLIIEAVKVGVDLMGDFYSVAIDIANNDIQYIAFINPELMGYTYSIEGTKEEITK